MANNNANSQSMDFGTLDLRMGSFSMNGTGVTATAAEINRHTDISTRLVAGGSSITLTEASHDSRTIQLDTAAGTTVQLPAATGSGMKFRFVVTVKPTSNQHRINVLGSDAFFGSINNIDLDGSAQAAFAAGTDADRFDMNGTTKGGQVGDFVTLEDVGTGKWFIFAQLQCPTGSNPVTSFTTGAVS